MINVPAHTSRQFAFAVTLLFGVGISGVVAQQSTTESIYLKSEAVEYQINPSNLQVQARLTGSREVLTISDGIGTLDGSTSDTGKSDRSLSVLDLVTTPGGAQWDMSHPNMRVAAHVTGDGLEVAFTNLVQRENASDQSGQLQNSERATDQETSLTWPVQPLPHSVVRAVIWPRGEGRYLPLDDPQSLAELTSQTWDTLEGLSLPLWGLETSFGLLSCVVDSQYHNEITLSPDTAQALILRFSHLFRRGEPQTITFRFHLTEPAQSFPIQPALDYRKWLIEREQFKTLAQKIEEAPETEKLIGAPQFYLWGGGVITRFDLAPKKANALAKQLVAQAEADKPSPGKWMRKSFSEEEWKTVRELAASDYQLLYAQTSMFDRISNLLKGASFYDEESWKGIELSTEVREQLAQPRSALTQEQLVLLNSQLFQSAYPDLLPPASEWGGGFSSKLLQSMRTAGIDRARLELPGWESITESGRSGFARRAIEMGYLIGPYDSYHSIHDPKTSGTDATWATAQFDQQLFETGAIIRADGTPRAGFKQRGFLLSPLVARPYVERRVQANQSAAPFNFYFFDCDGFGQLFDDYSPHHPATQMQDGTARVSRMQWVTSRFGAPVGTEGGSAYAVPGVALFEGILGGHFGWGDPLLNDRKSEYYLGAYFPPDEPAVFFKQVPVAEKYVREEFDPRYRLPLWEAAFHDAAISTHHWSGASLKFTNVQATVALTEMLYQAAPMYHINPTEFSKRKAVIQHHYNAFSPLHRITATLPLTGFAWLTADRSVQMTTFGDRVEVIVNFGATAHSHEGRSIPPGSALCTVDGKDVEYRPET